MNALCIYHMFSFFLLILFLRVFLGFPFSARNTHIPSKNVFISFKTGSAARRRRMKGLGKEPEIRRTLRKCGMNIVWEGIRGPEQFQRKQVKEFVYLFNKYFLSCLGSDTVLHLEALAMKIVLPSWSLCWGWS